MSGSATMNNWNVYIFFLIYLSKILFTVFVSVNEIHDSKSYYLWLLSTWRPYRCPAGRTGEQPLPPPLPPPAAAAGGRTAPSDRVPPLDSSGSHGGSWPDVTCVLLPEKFHLLFGDKRVNKAFVIMETDNIKFFDEIQFYESLKRKRSCSYKNEEEKTCKPWEKR